MIIFSTIFFPENIVKVLLDNGANPTIRNRKKQTPISVAQNINIQKLLVIASVEQFQLSSTQVGATYSKQYLLLFYNIMVLGLANSPLTYSKAFYKIIFYK